MGQNRRLSESSEDHLHDTDDGGRTVRGNHKSTVYGCQDSTASRTPSLVRGAERKAVRSLAVQPLWRKKKNRPSVPSDV